MYALVSNARLDELITELTEEFDELSEDQVLRATSLYMEVSEELQAVLKERRVRQTLGER